MDNPIAAYYAALFTAFRWHAANEPTTQAVGRMNPRCSPTSSTTSTYPTTAQGLRALIE